MKRGLVCLAMLWLVCGFSQAQDSGDTAYVQGDYLTAIQLYEAQIANGVNDTSIYINLGNAYWMSGNSAYALLNFLRVQQALPRDTDIATTLALIRAENGAQILNDSDLLRMLGTATNGLVTFQELSAGVWVLWVMTLLTAIIYRLWHTHRQVIRWLVLFSSSLFLVAFILLSTRYWITTQQPLAVVTADESIAYSGADSTYLRLFSLANASEIRILQQQNDWVRFVMVDGKQGWLPKNDIAWVNPN